MTLFPIILFCYNRADKTAEVIKSLQNNFLADKSELFVFCDGPKSEKDLIKVKEVHEVLDAISGFKNVTIEKRNLNFGLRNSVIYGINKALENHEAAIILEDDIITSKNFLSFMNEALEFYKNDPKMLCVSGFNYPSNIFKKPKLFTNDVFFLKGRTCSWGWGTWKDRWQSVRFDLKDYENFKKNKKDQKNFNKTGSNLSEMIHLQIKGKIDSWAIFFSYHAFKNNLYTVFPTTTLVKNIGFDGGGSHGDNNDKMIELPLDNSHNPKLINLNNTANNNLASKEYVFCTTKSSGTLISRKKQLKLRYLALGALIGATLTLIF